MITINYDVFRSDATQYEGWADDVDQCLPGGYGIGRDWLPADGLAPTSTVNGPPADLLLATFPNQPPMTRDWFGHIPGCDAYFAGYLAACQTEYEYIADGAIAMSMLGSLLLRTMEIYDEQDGASADQLNALRKEVAQL